MKQSTGISSKALVIGAVLIPINCYWVVQMEVVRYSGHPTVFSIFFNVILSVFVLVLVSLILSKLSPKLALSQGELLTIYVMLSIASGLSGRSMIQLLMPELGHAFWFATPENEWKDLFWAHISRWLAVDDMSVLEEYYRGDSSLYRPEHLKAWLPTVIAWGAFTCALVFVMLCVNVIVRRQWIDNEKLAYPIIQLPLEMTGVDAGFFRDRLMWVGFAIGAGFNVINGLHFFFPAIPFIRLSPLMLGDFLRERPWSAIAEGAYGRISPPRPFIVGLGFFIQLDLSFSCWFFFLFFKGQELLLEIMGQTIRRDFPEQSFGGYLALGFFEVKEAFVQLAQEPNVLQGNTYLIGNDVQKS